MVAIDVKNAPDRAPAAADYYFYAEYAVRYYNSSAKNYQSTRTAIPL